MPSKQFYQENRTEKKWEYRRIMEAVKLGAHLGKLQFDPYHEVVVDEPSNGAPMMIKGFCTQIEEDKHSIANIDIFEKVPISFQISFRYQILHNLIHYIW